MIVLLMLAGTGAALAQRGNPAPSQTTRPVAKPQQEDTLSVNVNLVDLLYTVADKKGNPLVKNVEGLTYATQENSYLVGCLAGLMVKKAGGTQTIGVVGGVKIPPVDTFLAGYKAGAAKCVPGTTVQIGYSQDFIDQAKCKQVAENQLDAGSQVVFGVAGPCAAR